MEAEIGVLKDAKEACERALEAKVIPVEVVTECLSIREGRRQFEVVRDEVENSLSKEKTLLQEIRLKLKDKVWLFTKSAMLSDAPKVLLTTLKCEDAWQQLNILEDVRQRLETDLEDKSEALKIDLDQLRLTERSSGLSHKPNPTRIPSKYCNVPENVLVPLERRVLNKIAITSRSIQVQTWHEFSTANRDLAEVELARSQRLRETIFHTIEDTNNDLRIQTESTNFNFRKRMYEMRRAKEECQYQISTVRAEDKLSLTCNIAFYIDVRNHVSLDERGD